MQKQRKLNLTHDLDGGNTFDGKTNKNPVTKKQKNIIQFIYEQLGIKFKGRSSKQAYKFINEYYETAKQKNLRNKNTY